MKQHRANKASERDSLKNEINTLVLHGEDYTQQIKKLVTSHNNTSSRVDVLTKSQRNGEESVYAAVGKIFQSIGAN